MSFENLLRSSRLMSLAKPKNSGYFTQYQEFPKNQAVKTTASSFHRRNWGLKAPIPPKHKSVNIHVQALDSVEGLAQYEPASGDVRRLDRFREFGVALRLPQGIDSDNFFQADSSRQKPIGDKNIYELKKLYKDAESQSKEFWRLRLDGQRADSQNQRSRVSALDRRVGVDAQEFMGLPKTLHAMRHPKQTAIGLNYSLPGSLFNTPDGFKSRKEVRGRVVDGNNTNRVDQVAAIGGFATSTTAPDRMKNNGDKAKFAVPHRFFIKQAGVSGARVEVRSAAVSLTSAKEHPIPQDTLQGIYGFTR